MSKALSEAIEIGDPAAVQAAADSLDALDRIWLADHEHSRAFWEQARDKLGLLTYMAPYVQFLGTWPPGAL